MSKSSLLVSSCVLILLSITMFASISSGTSISITSAPNIKIKESTSSNWSGYAIETSLSSPQKNAVTDVKGTWTVPAVTGTTTSYSSFWVGIDGYSSNSVEQIGTDSDVSSGKATYYAWYEMYPKYPVNLRMTISPGDQISAEVSYSGGKFILTITDTTTGATFTTTQKSPNAARSSAEWVAEAPSSSKGVLSLANFGTVYFTGCSATVNGHTGSISDSSWQNDAITMVISSGTVKAQPSALSNGGADFSVAWHHP